MTELTDRIYGHFKEQQVVSFATVEGQQPRVRPMTLIHSEDGFYMITGARGGKNAQKLRQVRENPRFEYYLALKGERMDGFIRGMGEALEVNDQDTRGRIYNMIGWASGFFPTVDHPGYVLMELRHDGFSFREPDMTEILRT
ncbi:pyridoxamine 5'-phosphate oxidase family protein [Candidatus Bathyarchaeota archaeon]|nr:pyridoxamine 5'-phosphate oxidase family protein [Candidatus Bathyarchaeota archaeon]